MFDGFIFARFTHIYIYNLEYDQNFKLLVILTIPLLLQEAKIIILFYHEH